MNSLLMRFYVVLILTIVVCLSGQWFRANAVSTSCNRIDDLLLFITQTTSYPMLEECPSIQVANSETLMSAVDFTNPESLQQPETVYLPTDNVVLISSDIDIGAEIGRSFLVHELVHALQFQTGAASRAPCVGLLEDEAYRVQSEYLKQKGFANEALASRFLGLVIGSCAHSYHPDF